MAERLSRGYILSLNVGSTSIKSRVFGLKGNNLTEVFAWSRSDLNPKLSHREELRELKKDLKKAGLLENIVAVGHRVVHGGRLKKSLILSQKELKQIEKYAELAPLHNPFNLEGIKEVSSWWSAKIPQIAVFDTAFFANLPDYASLYPIPFQLTKKYGFRRFGFHGISHQYALQEASFQLKKDQSKLNLIIFHLGGGASASAVKNGRAVDTSMGFTPAEGLMMSTRTGDIDPGIIFYLLDRGISLAEVQNILLKQSGFLGLTKAKNMLDIIVRVNQGDLQAKLVFKMFVYRIQKYLGAYSAILANLDAVIFTGSIGAGKAITRNQIVKPFRKTFLKNIPILAIPSNEEKMIAQEVKNLIKF